MRTRTLPGEDGHLDLVPLIDCIFLVLLFFMLCGRISANNRSEQITVPPARTAFIASAETGRVVVNLRSQGGPAVRIGPSGGWTSLADPAAWGGLRGTLDRVWDRSGRGPFGVETVVEVRADADTDWRIVQQVQQLIADSVDPATWLPRAPARPFTRIDLTARPARSTG